MSDTLRTIFALPSLQEFIVICGMLLATYSTRLIGWLVLRRHPVSPRMQRILDAAPCCPKSRSKPSRYSSENDVLIEKYVKYTDF